MSENEKNMPKKENNEVIKRIKTNNHCGPSTERPAIYVGNPLRSDLIFVIQSENATIYAHTFVIGVASPVFRAKTHI